MSPRKKRSRVTIGSTSSAGRIGLFDVFPWQNRLPACATAGLEVLVLQKSVMNSYRLAEAPDTPLSLLCRVFRKADR